MCDLLTNTAKQADHDCNTMRMIVVQVSFTYCSIELYPLFQYLSSA